MRTALTYTRRPDITFHTDGRIDITARVAKALSLHPGDVIDIADDGSEVYLYCKHHNAIGRHEAQCYATNQGKTCNNLRAHSRRLCKAIFRIVRINDDGTARLPVGEPTTHHTLGTALPIITHHNIHR